MYTHGQASPAGKFAKPSRRQRYYEGGEQPERFTLAIGADNILQEPEKEGNEQWHEGVQKQVWRGSPFPAARPSRMYQLHNSQQCTR